MPESTAGPSPALILCRNADTRRRLQTALTGRLPVAAADSLADGLELLRNNRSAVAFVEGSGNAAATMEGIRRVNPLCQAILVDTSPSLEGALKALRSGAVDYLNLECDPPSVICDAADRALERLRKAQQQQDAQTNLKEEYDRLLKINRALTESNPIDPETGLHNHRYLKELAESELIRCRRYQRSFSLLFANISSDSRLHNPHSSAHDRKLVRMASEQIRGHLRGSDTLVRYQEHVFGILLPETDRQAAECVAQNISGIWESVWTGSFADRSSVSLGVASFPEDGKDVASLMNRASGRIAH